MAFVVAAAALLALGLALLNLKSLPFAHSVSPVPKPNSRKLPTYLPNKY